jgi:hypothetical protein
MTIIKVVIPTRNNIEFTVYAAYTIWSSDFSGTITMQEGHKAVLVFCKEIGMQKPNYFKEHKLFKQLLLKYLNSVA